MMIWSLLEPSKEEGIYTGKVRSCPYPFLEDILTGKTTDLDLLSSVELVHKLEQWLQSNDHKAEGKAFGTSTLAEQVLNCSH